MRRIARPAVLLLLLGLGGAAAWQGYVLWALGRLVESTDNAYVRGDIVWVAPEVAGPVASVAVDDNRHVEAGDVLFRIDPADHEARLAQADAELAAAVAARRSLGEERALQDALVAEAQAALAAQQAEHDRARSGLRRSDRLVDEGWTSRQRHDEALAASRRAEATVAQARAALTARRQRLAMLDAEGARLDALVEQARARRRLAAIALEDTVVRAPIAGVVGNRQVEPGHYARVGTPVLTIVPLEQVWVVANLKETQLGRIRPGQPATVRVDTFGEKVFTGRVDSIAPASGAEFSLLPPDNATGNFVRVVQRIPVKIVLDAPDAILRPGMSAEAVIDTSEGAAPPGGLLSALAWPALAALGRTSGP